MVIHAWHDSYELRDHYLARVRAHRLADQLIQGTGAEGTGAEFRGCAVGCTLDRYEHGAYPDELGIPVVLAHLQDAIFEGLPPAEAQLWPEAFLSACEPGTDLSLVWPRFAIWLLTVEAPSAAGTAVAALYQRRIDGDEPTEAEWASSARAAWAARAAGAARAAWAAGAAGAAWAASAASAAGAASAVRAARAASYRRQRDQLLSILRAA